MEGQSYEGTNLNKELDFNTDNELCYVYPVHGIHPTDGKFIQTRSGPNWEGGRVTLTTCKHLMRTGKENYGDWVGVWIAGITPKSTCGDHYLLFLCKIELSFRHNHALGQYLKDNCPEAFLEKSSLTNTRGDLYIPKRELSSFSEAFLPENYHTPGGYHTRTETKRGVPKWHKDLNYRGYADRLPAVFLMSEEYSFIYSRPMYRLTKTIYRSGYKTRVNDFMANEILDHVGENK